MKGTAVIHDGASNFLGFNLNRWIPGGDGDIFEGTYCNAVRVARRAPREGRQVFVSKQYGYVDQEDFEILENGDIGKPTYPNAGR